MDNSSHLQAPCTSPENEANTGETAAPKAQSTLTRPKTRNRLTDADKAKLMETIKAGLVEGHPLQALALKHNMTMTLALKLFAKLMTSEFRHEITTPNYEVVPAGTQASKLPFEMLLGTEFIRVDRHENGILIQPFNMEESHV